MLLYSITVRSTVSFCREKFQIYLLPMQLIKRSLHNFDESNDFIVLFCFPFSCWSNWHNYENEISPQKNKSPEPEKQPLCHLCTLNPFVSLLMKFLFKGLLLCWIMICFLSLLVLHFVFIIVFLNFFLVWFHPCWRCSWSKLQKLFKLHIIHPLWFLFISSWIKMKNNCCWHKRYKSCHQVHQQQNVWNKSWSF